MKERRLFIKVKLSILLFILFIAFTSCIDDSPVEYNTYSITNINPPVDKIASSNNAKKVYIGHSLPVNISLTAEYDETDVPIQFYLLHKDDIEEVNKGIGDVGDIRMYYCHSTSLSTISKVTAGTHTYGLIINIPAEDAKDELTGDFKTGPFYVVAEVNKFEEAEIDAYKVYEKFKGSLDSENVITIASDYLKKPDLSVESMNFTGGSDDPNDVITFYNLVLNTLPGGENLPTIFVTPTSKDRLFTGTIHVKSSSTDSLNVPLKFTLKDESGSFSIPLEVYDKTMNGYVDTYYIPIIKANTIERISLGLRIPEDKDNHYLMDANYDDWDTDSPSITDYPISALRHEMEKDGDTAYRKYNFKIVAEVNVGGAITETRFISDTKKDVYTEADYIEDGDDATTTLSNNTYTQDLAITLEKMEVEPNEGITTYPYSKLTSPTEEDKVLVIYWDGLSFNVGDNTFGATAQAHEGMFFYNYSLFSFGIDIHATVFNQNLYLVNTYLNAESHLNDELKSGYDFHIEAANKVYLSDTEKGFMSKNWEHPILLWGAEKTTVRWYYCFKFTLTAGIETFFTPGLNLDINSDASLSVEKYSNIKASVYADANASIAGLATVGLYTYMDVLTLELRQTSYTKTFLDAVNYPNKIQGSLNREVGMYLIGPKGYINLYFEIDFLLFTKRWTKEIFRYSSFTLPIFEVDFLGSGMKNYWQGLEDTELADYDPNK